MAKKTLFVGIDLHKESLTICISDASGEERFMKLPTKCVNKISSVFEQMREKFRVVAAVESVGFYHWFWDLVRPLVDELHLANASGVRAAAGRRAKTDRNDAATLARLLRQDSLPTAFVPDGELWDFRQLLRHRMRLQRRVGSCKASLRMEMNKLNLPGPKNVNTASLHKWYEAQYNRLTTMAQLAIEDLGEQLALGERQLRKINQRIIRTVEGSDQLRPAIRRLETLPGIGLITAAVIHAESGGLARFNLEKEIICYAGLAPRTFQSADSCRHGRAADHAKMPRQRGLGRGQM